MTETDGGIDTGNPPANNGGLGQVATSSGTPFADNGVEYTARGTSDKDRLEYSSNAPRYEGTYYRIQIAALSRYDASNAKFANLGDYGMVSTEYIPARNLTRVMVGDYFNQSEATYALNELRKLFANAYVVRYDDGVRYGRTNF